MMMLKNLATPRNQELDKEREEIEDLLDMLVLLLYMMNLVHLLVLSEIFLVLKLVKFLVLIYFVLLLEVISVDLSFGLKVLSNNLIPFLELLKLNLNNKGYKLPTAKMSNSDLTSIINSDEIQSALRPKRPVGEFRARKKNPLRNFGFMVKLNPYAIPARRAELLRSAPGVKRTASDAVNAAKANRAKKGVAAKKRRLHSTLNSKLQLNKCTESI